MEEYKKTTLKISARINKMDIKNIQENNQTTEKEKLIEIRKTAIEEVKRLKKEGKSITTNAVEVVCREEDIFHTKSKKNR